MSLIFNNTNVTFDDDDTKDNTLFSDDKKITIFSEGSGKRKNTYIVRWSISPTEMKTHLKKLKTKLACNGSIKQINFDDKDELALHVQGYHINAVAAYLADLDIRNVIIKSLE